MAILSRKERDRQLRRADIFKAAEHLFAIKGYHKATMRDIAKEAQYATGTVYLHFKDKEALYFALLEEKIKALLSLVEGKVGPVKDARKKLGIFIQQGFVFFEKDQDFFRIFISEGAELSAEKMLFKSPVGIQVQEYTTNLLKEAQKQGVVSKDFDSEQLGEVFIAIIKTITLKWLQERKRGNDSLVNLSELVLKLFLYGAADK